MNQNQSKGGHLYLQEGCVCDAIYTKGIRHFFFLRMFNLKFSLMYSSLPHSSGTWAAGFHCDLGLWLSSLLWSWRRRRRTSKLRCHMVYFLKKRTRLSLFFFFLSKCSPDCCVSGGVDFWRCSLPPPPSLRTPSSQAISGAVYLSYLHCAGPITAFFFPHILKRPARNPQAFCQKVSLCGIQGKKGPGFCLGQEDLTQGQEENKSHPSPIFLSCLFSQILGGDCPDVGLKIISFTFQTTQNKADI